MLNNAKRDFVDALPVQFVRPSRAMQHDVLAVRPPAQVAPSYSCQGQFRTVHAGDGHAERRFFRNQLQESSWEFIWKPHLELLARPRLMQGVVHYAELDLVVTQVGIRMAKDAVSPELGRSAIAPGQNPLDQATAIATPGQILDHHNFAGNDHVRRHCQACQRRHDGFPGRWRSCFPFDVKSELQRCRRFFLGLPAEEIMPWLAHPPIDLFAWHQRIHAGHQAEPRPFSLLAA